jgi:hypothetical protein
MGFRPGKKENTNEFHTIVEYNLKLVAVCYQKATPLLDTSIIYLLHTPEVTAPPVG